jgi:hypothetical protein
MQVAEEEPGTEAIAMVRTSDSRLVREKEAMHLAYLTGWLGLEQIDDGTITGLAALLDIPDQAVRDGVAGALGGLGRRAKASAGPKLQQLLAEVDCQSANADSAEIIRRALGRMGIKTIPKSCATDRN